MWVALQDKTISVDRPSRKKFISNTVSSVGVIWRLFDHSALELLLFPVDLEGGHIIVWSKLVFPNKVEVHLL